MAGGSFQHSLLGGHAIREVGNAIISHQAANPGLERCDAHTSDLRIAVDGGKRLLASGAPPPFARDAGAPSPFARDADAAVVCDRPTYDEAIPTALTNPVVVFEVLSPSSEGYDRGLKFDYYGALETLREYVIVHQDERRVEVRTRASAEGEWRYATIREIGGGVRLPSLGVELPMAGLYRNWEAPRG